jgi:hypothetical protein
VKTEPARAAVHLGTRIDEPIRLEHSSPTVPASRRQTHPSRSSASLRPGSAGERWDSLLADGSVDPGEMTSFNYALGAVANWMHRTIGGLSSLESAARSIRIAPVEHGHYSFTAMVPPTRLPEGLR